MIIELVQGEVSLRRRRSKHFPESIFGEPAWDVLLDLYLAKAASRALSISDLAVGAAVPPSTVSRWILLLEDRALVERAGDHDDARRTLVTLTEKGRTAVEAIFDPKMEPV